MPPLAPHDLASDLADLVIDLEATLRSVAHLELVCLTQEPGGLGRFPETLPAAYLSQLAVMLARPIDVDPTRDAVPLVVRCLGTALWASHRRSSQDSRLPSWGRGFQPGSKPPQPEWRDASSAK